VDGPEVKYRIPDLVLLVLLVLGGLLAWQSARERARLERDYERLVRATGDLPISDPTRAHFRALETGEPLHFAWRVYLPANYPVKLRSREGEMGSGVSSSPEEFIARVRLREDHQGNWSIYQAFHGGSSRGSLGGKELNDLLRRSAGKILVEQLGAKATATVEPNGSAVLLRLSLPEDIQTEARTSLPTYEQSRFIPDLFVLEFGPEKPKLAPPPTGTGANVEP
jgi:hypothetical protein